MFYNNYYNEMVGSGLGVYGGKAIVPSGVMNGNGLRSTLAKMACKVLPYAKMVGKRLLTGTAGLASDLLSGESFESSTQKHLASAGRDIVSDFSGLNKKRSAKKKEIK